MTLSHENCPYALRIPIFKWSQVVPAILALSSECLEDVRRLLYGARPPSTARDTRSESIAEAIYAAALPLGEWCLDREPPAYTPTSVPLSSPAEGLDAVLRVEQPFSISRTKRRQSEEEKSMDLLPRRLRGRLGKNPTTQQTAPAQGIPVNTRKLFLTEGSRLRADDVPFAS